MKENKGKKRWGLILFIVFIMIGTSVSFVFLDFGPQNEIIKDTEIKFVRYPDHLEAKINGNYAAFSFLPSEVESIPVPSDISSRLQNKFEIDATYDFNSTYREAIALAHHQMELTLATYNIYFRKGFTTNTTFNLPVITCNDATPNVPVIFFKYSNSTNIHYQKDCIIAEAASNQDFIRIKDRLVYAILGVVK
ncbi:hypothetical protein HYW20_04590 [Candidatus Woesearchaeota archaeon]|nr:hypothetical protein [Candidatus Woesearchaeota archaeon]